MNTDPNLVTQQNAIVRYAPSPTGRLHLGNARPALLNWLFARANNGTYVLRLDDTDTARSTEEFARGIEIDLSWLGIAPDIKVRQSDRTALYDAARDALIATGRLYPAYETEEELEIKRGRARLLGRPPVYDRAALALTDAQKARYEAEGRKPHWRFRLDGRPVHFTDLIKGPQTVNTASMSDPVLIRADGSYLYTLPSVVDDIDLAITHVIRGEDHVSNTGTQIEIFEALGGKVPAFAHHNLLTGAEGEGLFQVGVDPLHQPADDLAPVDGVAAAVLGQQLPQLRHQDQGEGAVQQIIQLQVGQVGRSQAVAVIQQARLPLQHGQQAAALPVLDHPRLLQIGPQTPGRHPGAGHGRGRALEPGQLHMEGHAVEMVAAVAVLLPRGEVEGA